MAKLLLLSVIFATVAIPVRAARLKNPRLGLRKALLWLALFNVFYVFSLVYIYHRL